MKWDKERIENIFYIAFGIVCWLLIWQKAINIPMTHDEVGTAIYYGFMSIKDIITYENPVPNNHILNTLLLKLSMNIFGVHPWAIRLPNILAFLCYYFFAIKFLRKYITNSILQYVGLLLFVLNPYFFDFFSLARGYAMSTALMMASIFYFFEFVKNGDNKNLILTLSIAVISVLANFTILNYYMPLLLFIAVASLISNYKDNKKLIFVQYAICAGFTLFLGAISYLPITKMVATKQFIYWGSSGFYNDTLKHLLFCSRYNVPYFDWPLDMMLLIMACIISFFVILVVLLNYNWKKWNLPLISFLLLLVVGMYNVLQHNLMDVPFLNARTAIFLIPLTFIPFIFALERLRAYNQIVGMILIVFLGGLSTQHFIRAYKSKSAFEWYLDENTYQVLDKIKEIVERENLNKPVKLNCTWVFHPSLLFHTQYDYPGMMDLVTYHKDVQPNSDTEFYYAQPEDLEVLKSKYEIVWAINGGHRYLLRLKKLPPSTLK